MNDYSFPPHDAGYPGRGYRFVEDPAVVCSDLNFKSARFTLVRGGPVRCFDFDKRQN